MGKVRFRHNPAVTTHAMADGSAVALDGATGLARPLTPEAVMIWESQPSWTEGELRTWLVSQGQSAAVARELAPELLEQLRAAGILISDQEARDEAPRRPLRRLLPPLANTVEGHDRRPRGGWVRRPPVPSIRFRARLGRAGDRGAARAAGLVGDPRERRGRGHERDCGQDGSACGIHDGAQGGARERGLRALARLGADVPRPHGADPRARPTSANQR